MAKSLQDQLLASGVAKPKQAKKARRDKTRREQEARRQGTQSEESAKLARDVAAAEQAKRERDQQLAEQQKNERASRESQGAAAQLIAQNRIKPGPAEDDSPAYSYNIAGKIRKLAVSAPQRQQLADGKLGIVRHAGSAALINRDVAQRLQTLIPDQIWLMEPRDDTPDPDDPYAGYEVPDDLMW